MRGRYREEACRLPSSRLCCPLPSLLCRTLVRLQARLLASKPSPPHPTRPCPQDGSKQDALDLLSGAYTLKPGVKVIFTTNHSPLVPLLAAGLCFVLAARSLGQLGRGELLAEGEDSSGLGGAVLLCVVAPLLAAAGIVLLVQRYGRQLVKRPQLLPGAANTLAGVADK